MQITKIQITPRDISKIPAYFQDSDGFYSLDLYERPKIALTYQDDTIADGSIDGKGINRSYHINVPFTPKNDLLLENIKSANVVNTRFQTGDFVFAKVLVGSDVVLDGLLTITNTDKLIYDKTGDYEIFVFGNERNWIDILKNTKLNELPFADFDFQKNTALSFIQQLNPQYIKDGINDIDKYYLAPVFSGKLKKQDYDDLSTYNQFSSEDLSITIWLGYIMRLIEKQLPGYRFESQLLSNEAFKKKTLHCLENFRQFESDVRTNQFKINRTANIDYNTVYNGVIEFNSKTPDNATINLHSFATDTTTIQVTGMYKLSFDVSYVIFSNKDVVIQSASSDLKIYKNGVLVHTNALALSGGNFTHYFEIELSLFDSDVLTYEVENTVNQWTGNLASGESPDFKTRLLSDSKLYLNLLKEIINMVINTSDYIDNRFTCWDIFQDVLTLYNCSLRTDYDLKIIYFDSPNDFYQPNHKAIDWTNKLDASKKIKIASASNIRYAIFQYVKDSGDKYYNQEESGGRIPLYDYEYDFESLGVKRLEGSQTVKLSVISATKSIKIGENAEVPCVTENQVFKGTPNATGPIYYRIEEEGERTYKFNPRLFHVEGWGKYNGEDADWMFDELAYTEVPKVWFVNRLETNVEQLSGESIFLTYWQQTLAKINLNGLTTAYFVLSVADIKSLDTSVKIKLLNDFYYLKKVLNWLANNPDIPTQVTLLLDDSVKIVRHSVFPTI